MQYLGRSARSVPVFRKLLLGKFIGGEPSNTWHGYPADHVQNSQDIPPASILRQWLESKILRPAQIRKISKGQKCSL